MLKTISLFLLFFSLNSQALELQCDTDKWDDALIVVKTSEFSGVTYLLLLNDTELEKYWFLDEPGWSYTDDGFHFDDGHTSIDIDPVEGVGNIKSEAPFMRGELDISLKKCKSFPLTPSR